MVTPAPSLPLAVTTAQKIKFLRISSFFVLCPKKPVYSGLSLSYFYILWKALIETTCILILKILIPRNLVQILQKLTFQLLKRDKSGKISFYESSE